MRYSCCRMGASEVTPKLFLHRKGVLLFITLRLTTVLIEWRPLLRPRHALADHFISCHNLASPVRDRNVNVNVQS